MGKKKAKTEELAVNDTSENVEFISVSDGEFNACGDEVPVSTFSFDDSSPIAVPDQKSADNLKLNNDVNTSVNSGLEQTFTQKVRGLTPKRDDEAFDIKRCYQFRASTIKKLNLIKCNSNDTNIYLNEVLDDAICFYYNSLFKD